MGSSSDQRFLVASSTGHFSPSQTEKPQKPLPSQSLKASLQNLQRNSMMSDSRRFSTTYSDVRASSRTSEENRMKRSSTVEPQSLASMSNINPSDILFDKQNNSTGGRKSISDVGFQTPEIQSENSLQTFPEEENNEPELENNFEVENQFKPQIQIQRQNSPKVENFQKIETIESSQNQENIETSEDLDNEDQENEQFPEEVKDENNENYDEGIEENQKIEHIEKIEKIEKIEGKEKEHVEKKENLEIEENIEEKEKEKEEIQKEEDQSLNNQNLNTTQNSNESNTHQNEQPNQETQKHKIVNNSRDSLEVVPSVDQQSAEKLGQLGQEIIKKGIPRPPPADQENNSSQTQTQTQIDTSTTPISSSESNPDLDSLSQEGELDNDTQLVKPSNIGSSLLLKGKTKSFTKPKPKPVEPVDEKPTTELANTLKRVKSNSNIMVDDSIKTSNSTSSTTTTSNTNSNSTPPLQKNSSNTTASQSPASTTKNLSNSTPTQNSNPTNSNSNPTTHPLLNVKLNPVNQNTNTKGMSTNMELRTSGLNSQAKGDHATRMVKQQGYLGLEIKIEEGTKLISNVKQIYWCELLGGYLRWFPSETATMVHFFFKKKKGFFFSNFNDY